jgi:type 1 glutamine amidotransferase
MIPNGMMMFWLQKDRARHQGSCKILARGDFWPFWTIGQLVILTVLVWAKSSQAAQLPNRPAADRIRVLIVTGEDYPGHHWQSTARVLCDLLREDPRLDVRTVEDVAFLASEVIRDYQVLVLHFKNYPPPPRAQLVYENLEQFVRGGGGVLLTHFACGAFEQWPGFIRIAGRIWDKQKRPHDPYGTFTVQIVDSEHAITSGIPSFQITDELYTCLGGDEPIHVLASARSRVDGQEYPMIFVREFGKGRVVHSVLGHDTNAYSPPEYRRILRRAIYWLAGRENEVSN